MMDFVSTLKDSALEGFYPAGWDIRKFKEICNRSADRILEKEDFWNEDFKAEAVFNRNDWDVKTGHEIALQIAKAKEEGKKLAMLLQGTPLSQYVWAAYFLKIWKVSCDHVYAFTMNDWCDSKGNPSQMFEEALETWFYDRLGEYTVPMAQRFAATPQNLPLYEEKIDAIRKEGGRLITVYGIGRNFNLGFWEPDFAAECTSFEEYSKQMYRVAAGLNPLTNEQYALTTFGSNFTLVPARGNTAGIGLILKSDYMIGGCEFIAINNGETSYTNQGMALWITLHCGPDMWVPSSYVPTIPGRFFFVGQLAQIDQDFSI